MLHLLLDEHLSPRLVREFQRKRPAARIDSVLHWQGGRLAGIPDNLVLATASEYSLTLVTYDQATIVPLIRRWSAEGIPHGGIILVDNLTIRQNDIGGLMRALGMLWDHGKTWDWTNQVIYLKRAA